MAETLNFDYDAYKWGYNDEWSVIKSKYNSSLDFLKELEQWIKNEEETLFSVISDGKFSDLNFLSQYARIDSPYFTGTPSAISPDRYDNSNRICTTQWVDNRLQEYTQLESPTFSGFPTVPTPDLNNNSTQIANTEWVKNVLKTYYAPLDSPKFTGTPTAPTPELSSNDSHLATTAFVTNKVNELAVDFIKVDSPNFTGTPTAPTPSTENNSTQVATTAFVHSAITAQINKAKENLKDTYIESGIAAHDETIPIPDGYSRENCTFMVSLNSYDTTPTGPKYTWNEHVSVNAQGRVTCYVESTSADMSTSFSGKVNYLLIAQR